jgi:hypothetical protein
LAKLKKPLIMNKSIGGAKFPWCTARSWRWITSFLAACLLPVSAFSQLDVQVTGAHVTEVGIYASRVATDETNSAGVRLQGLDDFHLILSTTNIPARIGVRFGFRYEILGTPANAPILLTMVCKHPPMTNSALPPGMNHPARR